MTLPRLDNDRVDLITRQFCDSALYHPNFIHKDSLSAKDKLDLRFLAQLYDLYRQETGLDKLYEAGRKMINPPNDEWRKMSQPERYHLLNDARALILSRTIDGMLNNIQAEVPGGKCLDFGTGSGYLINVMNETHPDEKWYGVDIPDEKRAEITAGTPYDRKHIETFREYNGGEYLPFPEEKFGLITMNYVLHHVDEKYLEVGSPHNILGQIYDRMAPGGHLMIHEDNIGEYEVNPIKLAYVKKQDEIFYPNSAGKQRTMDGWSRLLMKNGFQIIRHGEATVCNSIGILTNDAIIVARKPAI